MGEPPARMDAPCSACCEGVISAEEEVRMRFADGASAVYMGSGYEDLETVSR